MSYRKAINLSQPKNQKAIQEVNKKIPIANTPELQEQWMTAYIEAGGEYEEIEPSGKKPSDVKQSCIDCVKNKQEKYIVNITVVSECNKSPHAKCISQGIENVKVYVEGKLKGKTDKNGYVKLEGEKLSKKIVTIKHELYLNDDNYTIQKKKSDHEFIMKFDQSQLSKKINSTLNIKKRGDWSTRTPDVSEHEEDRCYSIVTIHHAGDYDIDTPLEVEEKHMGDRCTFCFSSPNGWTDIGYHYLINDKGQIYEGRQIGYKGSHVGGNNSYKIGINFLNDYNTEGWLRGGKDPLSRLQFLSCINLIKTLKEYFPLQELGGHKDYAVNSDDDENFCPGNILYATLDILREKTGLTKPMIYNKTHAHEIYNKCE